MYAHMYWCKKYHAARQFHDVQVPHRKNLQTSENTLSNMFQLDCMRSHAKLDITDNRLEAYP
jgi:hypothetical protein